MKKKNILVLAYWSYKEALVQAYTIPYVYIIADLLPPGSKIFLVTLEQDHLRMSMDEKIQAKERLRLKGIRLVTFKYRKLSPFNFFYWVYMGCFLWALTIFRNIRYIHAWCTTAGSFGYALSVLTGKKLVIDSYEPHAEAMVENKTWKLNGVQFRILFYLERKLSKRARIIISATEKMREYARDKYGVTLKNFYVKPACVDVNLFTEEKRKNSDLIRQFRFKDRIVCVYAGKFGGIYLTREVFDFFKACQEFWGDRFRVLLLTSHNKDEIQEWCEQSGFDKSKLIMRFVSHEDVPVYMGLGDFAITPVKPIPTKRYCTPIKDGEYWALGLPIVITPNISDDSDIIEANNIGAIIKHFDRDSYLEVIHKMDSLLQESRTAGPTQLGKKIRGIASTYRNFEIANRVYREIYGEKMAG